jgi:two-component system sensor histidine kinase TctE
VQLLRRLLPPIAGLLALGGLLAYFPSIESATEAYDLALTDAGLALGERIRTDGGRYTIDLPGAADQVLRTDKHDTIYYVVRAPDGATLAGDPDLPPPPPDALPQDGVIAYDADYRGNKVRAVTVLTPCGGAICTVQVAETTNKRNRLARGIVLSSVLPEFLIAAAMLAVVWFGVKRGLEPLDRLSGEIKSRSPREPSPVDLAHAPAEAHTLVSALNQLLERVADSNRNQQRFLANAAHQLRTPLAGLQAHTELAMAQPVPESCRAELEYVHRATVRTVRLANQLLSLARAEPGGSASVLLDHVDLRSIVDDAADEWVHQALARGVDLGFDLAECRVKADAFLLREAFANIVHNALDYAGKGATVTVRTVVRTSAHGTAMVFEVEDDGPGIPAGERERVLERFYRVAGTPGEGSGLGLAIVQEIALAHGGRLDIGDGPGGKGSCVALVFPVRA